ncbi:MAG: PAS domain S-box protein, partial [Paludibacter sp.]
EYFVNEVIGNKQYFDKEYQILRIKDNSLRWVHGLGELIFDQKAELLKMVGTIQDITERKLNEEKIQKSEEKFRSIFENIQDVFYRVDLSGRIIEISPSAKAFGGFYDFTIPNQYIQNLYSNPEDRDKFLQQIQKEGEVRDYELDIIGTNAEIKHVSINAKLIRDEFGNPSHIDGALRDISKRKIAQNALVESEKFLKEIQLIAHIGNWTVDLQQNTWIGSEILDQIFGMDDSIEKNFKTLASIIHPESIPELTDIYANEFTPSERSFDKKFKIIRLNDKAERWVHAIGELRFDENKRPKQMIGTVQDITLRKKDKEALRQSQEELKNFASHLQTVREEERNILAREIHDDLGQILIAMKIDLGLLQKSTLKTVREDNYNDLNSKFKTLSMLIDNTLISARRIMTDLRPEVLDMIGFVEAVKQHLNNFQERTKINCSFETNTSKLELNSEQSVALFRIVQEALNNVSKHSRATEVNINFTQINEELILSIEDNGIGFNQNETVRTQSYGLIGIRERVLLLDGELTLNSVKGNGTKLIVSIPYHKQETGIRNQLITNTNF